MVVLCFYRALYSIPTRKKKNFKKEWKGEREEEEGEEEEMKEGIMNNKNVSQKRCQGEFGEEDI